jgi:drug/metabolite transporter (DMT)-like permease
VDYTRLVFTAVAGYLLFQEVPSPWTLAGAAVVVGSTLFITLREQQLARSARLSEMADVDGA